MLMAFHLSEEPAPPRSGLPLGGQERRWVGGRMPAGPDGVPAAPTLYLTLGDLPPAADCGAAIVAGWWIGEQILPGDLPAPAAGGLLCNLMSIDAAHEEEFNAWYDNEHMARIGALPGVIAARRFRAIGGSPGYAAFYHLESLAVSQTAAWGDAARSPWTSRIQRYRTDNRRLGFVPGGHS